MNRAFLLSSVIVAAASEVAAAAYVLGHLGPAFIRKWLLWEEVLAAILMFAPYAAASVAALAAGVALAMRRLRVRRARWLSQGPWISAGILVAGSMVLLGPVGGFHHMFRFGVLGYMILDCDSPEGKLPIRFGRCEIRGSAVLLIVTVAAWLCSALLLSWLLRRRAARSAEPERW